MLVVLKKIIKSNKFLYAGVVTVLELIRLPQKIKIQQDMNNNGVLVSQKIYRALKRSDISYFYACGSLLGLIREHGFIKNDIDIDVAILCDEHFRWENLEHLLVSDGFKKIKEFIYEGNITEQTYLIDNVKVDFFLNVNTENFTVGKVYYRLPGVEYNDKQEYTAIDLVTAKVENINHLEIKGNIYAIPENFVEYLESVYTENWREPNPSWKASDSPAWKVDRSKIGRVVLYEK